MDASQLVSDIVAGQFYRLWFRNVSDHVHPMHLHRNRFEIISVTGTFAASLHKDVAMLGDYQAIMLISLPSNPGCHYCTMASNW
ncbi:multicopper oxidase domain-containing protein [Mycobacterium lepromatosis]|uniref:multicopper oxidase domain-containing protein n=1 Tax=Mycobacterium lepromatosis TaxID=480418 RepID=UPI00138DE81F